MNRLFSELFRDFWPGFLALDNTAGGGEARWSGGGRGGDMKNTVLPLEFSNPNSRDF